MDSVVRNVSYTWVRSWLEDRLVAQLKETGQLPLSHQYWLTCHHIQYLNYCMMTIQRIVEYTLKLFFFNSVIMIMAIWNLRALLFSWLSSFENCATILTQAILTSFDPYQSLVWLFPSFHVAFPPGQKPLGQGCGLSFNRWYAVYTWSWSGTISNFCESEYPFGKTLSYKEYRKKEKKKKAYICRQYLLEPGPYFLSAHLSMKN